VALKDTVEDFFGVRVVAHAGVEGGELAGASGGA
jgi:hypothetical protein